jgi:hypothetical protein
MTTTVHTIGTGGDYTVPQLWCDAAPADLVGAQVIWEGHLFNQVFPPVVLGGKTTSAAYYLFLTTAPGASFRDNIDPDAGPLWFDETKGATIRFVSGNGYALRLSSPYAQVFGVQLDHTGAAYSCVEGLQGGSVLDSCICVVDSNTAVAIQGGLAGAMAHITDCLVIQRGPDYTAKLTNNVMVTWCTMVRSLDGAGAVQCTNLNTVDSSYFTAEPGAPFVGTITNQSDDASNSTAVVANWDIVPFTNANFVSTSGQFDMRLPAGSLLIGAVPGFTGGVDIFGTPRGNEPEGIHPCIGCFEYVSAAPVIPPETTASGGTLVDDVGRIYTNTGTPP